MTAKERSRLTSVRLYSMMTSTFLKQRTAPTAAKAVSRDARLDFLRGVAILLVIGNHIHTSGHSWEESLLFLPVQYAGWSGVPLFFVLSGYLIGGLLFSEFQSAGQIDIKRFLIRRGLKIYPAFYFYLVATAFYCACSAQRVDAKALLCESLFIQNYTVFHWLMPHTWSLAVEEHFYIGFAAVLLLFSKLPNGFKAIPWICLTIMLLCFIGRSFDNHLVLSHLRVDAMAFGVLLSYLKHFHPETLMLFIHKKYTGTLTFIFLFLGVLIRPELHWIGWVFGLTSLNIGCGSLVVQLTHSTWGNNPVQRFISWMGVYSYSIYLWHMTVLYALTLLLPRPFPLIPLSLLYYGVAIATGVSMAKMIECPMLRLRERFAK